MLILLNSSWTKSIILTNRHNGCTQRTEQLEALEPQSGKVLINLSVCPSIYLSIYPSTHPFIHFNFPIWRNSHWSISGESCDSVVNVLFVVIDNLLASDYDGLLSWFLAEGKRNISNGDFFFFYVCLHDDCLYYMYIHRWETNEVIVYALRKIHSSFYNNISHSLKVSLYSRIPTDLLSTEDFLLPQKISSKSIDKFLVPSILTIGPNVIMSGNLLKVIFRCLTETCLLKCWFEYSLYT